MKKYCTLPSGFLSYIITIALLGAPCTAMAMGGEGLAAGLLILVFWFVVWLASTAASFIPKTKPRTAERYSLWAIRLSFPAFIAFAAIYYTYLDPYLGKLRAEKRKSLEIEARLEFSSLCEQHIPQSTQILATVNAELPKRLFIDETRDYSGLDINMKLAQCVTQKLTPACSSMALESIEWSWINTLGPCKSGVVPDTNRCLPEYRRYDLVEGRFNYFEFDQPTSNYIIRVEKAIKSGEGIKEFEKYQVTLETKETHQVLAKTEVLKNRIQSPPCPNPENEVAQMLLGVFSKQ